MKNRMHTEKKQRGFTLIESLMTLFILSIGMLGIAGMQLQGLRSGGLAMQQMAAVMKTQEILERMRAAVITDGGGNIEVKAINLLSLYDSGTGADKACINGTVCTTEEMVLFDLYQWEKDIENVLPGTVTPSISMVGRTVTVAIDWMDKGNAYNYTVSSQL